MDALTEMKEHITREERIEEEKDLMIDNTQNNILEIKERITRLGEENRQLIMENASLKEEIHELRDKEMKTVKDADEDRKEMKKLKEENEKLKEVKNHYQNLWYQGEIQILSLKDQLGKERAENLKFESTLCGDEPIKYLSDLSKEFDIIIKRLNKIKTITGENSVPKKEYQFR